MFFNKETNGMFWYEIKKVGKKVSIFFNLNQTTTAKNSKFDFFKPAVDLLK